MDTAKYIIKKAKLMTIPKTIKSQKQTTASINKLKTETSKLNDTSFLLSQMYSQENDVLFI